MRMCFCVFVFFAILPNSIVTDIFLSQGLLHPQPARRPLGALLSRRHGGGPILQASPYIVPCHFFG